MQSRVEIQELCNSFIPKSQHAPQVSVAYVKTQLAPCKPILKNSPNAAPHASEEQAPRTHSIPTVNHIIPPSPSKKPMKITPTPQRQTRPLLSISQSSTTISPSELLNHSRKAFRILEFLKPPCNALLLLVGGGGWGGSPGIFVDGFGGGIGGCVGDD
jgi:hypothetical protein